MLSKIIEATIVIVLAASAAGRLPQLTHALRLAQIQLLRDSQLTKWGRAFLLSNPRQSLP